MYTLSLQKQVYNLSIMTVDKFRIVYFSMICNGLRAIYLFLKSNFLSSLDEPTINKERVNLTE
jgi:hypothetical protein